MSMANTFRHGLRRGSDAPHERSRVWVVLGAVVLAVGLAALLVLIAREVPVQSIPEYPIY